MANRPTLLDQFGQPVVRAKLREPQAAATVGGVRSPLTGYPVDGLNPVRLATILREADGGEPVRYLEMAETIEERDPHYAGVLGTRRRSVSQLEIDVEPGGDSQFDLDRAEEVRAWLARDELADELFDILDAIGKGYSFTEIDWEYSMGQWRPGRLDRRDQRWFRFDRWDLTTPQMITETGQDEPLPAFKFIFARFKAKSGIPTRSGLARIISWPFMFKAFTLRDWAIFCQTFGQPLRIGKWGPGASEQDKDTLFRAVANIAGDCAAIIPETMSIEFEEASNVGSSTDLYLKRADFLDQQVSKAVLGQTATTDAIAGGHAVGQEHRSVQEDIERADARQLEAVLNRDLITPWMQLNYGKLTNYPRIRIAREEQEDLALAASNLDTLVRLGLEVPEEEVRQKFGWRAPKAGEPIMRLPPENPDLSPAGGQAQPEGPEFKRLRANLNGATAPRGGSAARDTLNAEMALREPLSESSGEKDIEDQLAELADPVMGKIMARIEAMVDAAGSMEELAQMIEAGFDDLDISDLTEILGEAMVAAMAAGRAEIVETSDDG
ncbi:MAG: DUF935 domain-containing protein [Pseudomonadota bacterium]